jgi:hypothetical protein
MKTAMQELIDELKLIEAYPMSPLVLKMATELLEKEKEQILRAFELGMHECLAYDANSIKYYNQTYKPETI